MSTQWVHEQVTGPVAWAAAVVTVTAVPMLAFLAWHVAEPLLGPGPKALLGGALGWTLAGVLGIPSWWAALGLPLVGVAMLLVPVGVVRQVGAGLATSVLVWPLVAASALVALGIGG